MKSVSQNTPTIYSATTPENNPPQLVASLVPDQNRRPDKAFTPHPAFSA